MKTRRNALAAKVVSCVISAVIAMGLMPLPAFAAESKALHSSQLAAGSVASTLEESPIPVGADDKQWTGASASNGWYAVEKNTSLANRVEVSGDVNLVLHDGATLTANKGINVPESASLTIWAQSQGDSMGSLVAQSADKSQAAIGSNGTGAGAGSLTINGGNVSATTCEGGGAAAIGGGENDGCGVITINGGKVTASSSTTGATIGSGSNGKTAGKITISGGEVNAKHGLQTGISTAVIGGGSSSQGVDITINGGSVSAVAENESTGKSTYAIGRRESKNLMDSATLDYNEQKPDISVYAYYGEEIFDNYCGPYGAGVDIKKPFTIDTGDTIQGNWLGYNGNTNKKLNGKTLVASNSWAVATDAMEHGSVKLDTSRAIAGKSVALSVEPDADYALLPDSLKATYVENGEQKEIVPAQDADDPTKFTFTMPGANVTVAAEFAMHEHHFAYAADGATLTAACDSKIGKCDLADPAATLTIVAPEHATYGDGKAANATLEGLDAFNATTGAGVSEAAIAYTGTTRGGATYASNKAPTEAGDYTASITAGEDESAVTASAAYTIAPREIKTEGNKNANIVLSKTSFIYNENVQKPTVKTVTVDGKTLVEGKDFSVSYPASKATGAYNATVTGIGNYAGKATATYIIAKATNPMKVTAKLAKASASKLAKKAQKVKASSAFAIKNAVGKVTFKKASGAKCITVKSSGQLVLKKGTKKGTYSAKVKVMSVGDTNHEPSTKIVMVKIKVK